MTPKVITIRNLNGKEDEIMKTTRFFAIIACAAAVAASCMKDELKDNVYVEPIFTAVREDFGGPASKTMLTDNYKVVWCSGDEVGVFDGSVYPRKGVGSGSQLVNKESGWEYGLRFKTTDNGASAGFGYEAYDAYKDEEPEVYAPGAADSYLLIHPMAVNFIANVSEGKFRAWLSNSQKAEAGTYDSARGFAVAKTSDLSEPVRFKNAVTLMEFVIPDSMSGKVKTIKVTPAGSNINIAGDLLIDYSGADVVTSPWGSTAGESKTPKTDVTLTPKSGTAFASGKYYMVVCPGTYDVITVEATLSSGVVLKRESSKGPYTFKPGYVYGMGVIDAASENYNDGIREFPYMFSVYTEYGPKGANTGADNSYKYVTAVMGSYNSSTYQLENIYTDSEYSSVKLNVKMAGTKIGQVRDTPVWANQWGYDNIPAKSFVSPEFLTALGEESSYKDVETYFLLKAPLATTLGNRFNVSVGMYVGTGGLRNWKIEYSNDGETWYGSDQGTFAIVNTTVSYRYYTVTFDSKINFTVGDILYVKLSPVGTVGVNGNPAACWNNDARLTSGILVYPLSEGSTPVPSEAIYFESFDKLTEGADYLLGERLGAMDNLHGPLCSDWSDEQINGLTLKKVAMRPGYAQIGYVTNGSTGNTNASNKGSLTTPALVAGQLNLSFKAMTFHTNKDRLGNYSASDCTESSTINDVKNPDATSIVLTINEGSFSQTESLKTYTIDNVSTSEWETKNLVIYGATADTQITFSSPEDATYARWFLDDICVTKAQ